MLEPATLPDPFVTMRDSKPMADSRIVARMFNKRHDSVLRSIRGLLKSPHVSPEYFFERFDDYVTGKGQHRKRRYYLMTNEGFMLLVMGFTGRAAYDVKVKILRQFQQMSALIGESN